MKILSYLVMIFFGAFLILFNFQLLVLNRNFYKNEFTKLEVYREFESKEVVNSESANILNYLCCGKDLSGDFFTQREKLHLADVKNLLTAVSVYFFLVSVLIVSSLVALILKKEKKLIADALVFGSVISIVAIAIISTGISINFQKPFVAMHEVLFQNDLWQLSEESNLIRMFPERFFADFANRVGSQTLIMAAIVATAAFLWRGKLASRRR